MSTAIAVVLLALAGQPPQDAEKLYNDMAGQLQKAATLEVSFTARAEGAKKADLKGVVKLAAGNKALTVVEGELGGKPFRVTVVSDGTNQQTRAGGGDAIERPTPPTYNALLTAIVERLGAFNLLLLRADDDPAKLRANFTPGNFKLGKVEMVGGRPAQAIEYQITSEKSPPMQVTLWLDAKTNLPLRRVTRLGADALLTEDYATFRVNVPLEAGTFDLPK
jgi:outer membrane lipoprotein-sorting protein